MVCFSLMPASVTGKACHELSNSQRSLFTEKPFYFLLKHFFFGLTCPHPQLFATTVQEVRRSADAMSRELHGGHLRAAQRHSGHLQKGGHLHPGGPGAGRTQKSSQLLVRETHLDFLGSWLTPEVTMGSSVIHHPSEFQSVWMISQGPKKLYIMYIYR